MNKKEMLLKGAAIILIGGSAIREIHKLIKGYNERDENIVDMEELSDNE